MLTGVVGAVYKTGLVSTAFTDEATTKDTTNTRYTINTASKRFVDDTATITVKKAGVVQASGWKIEHAGGVVVFDVATNGTDAVLVTGKAFTSAECMTMFNWKLDIGMDLKDATTFASNGWKEYVAGLGNWSASAEGFWASGEFLALMGERMIIQLFVDDVTKKRYEGYIIIKKNSIDEPVDNVVKESLDLEGTGKLYYHEG